MRVAYTPLSLAISAILLSSIVHAEVVQADTADTEATVQKSQKATTIDGTAIKDTAPQVHQLQVITVQAHPLSQSENDLVQASNII